MKVGALLTSAGINIGLCVLFLSLYSILRTQSQNVKVYFRRRIAEEHRPLPEAFILERFVPSTGWIVKSLQCTEYEILATAGLDAVVFNRILVFREDEQSGRMDEIHCHLHSAYCQFLDTDDIPVEGVKTIGRDEDGSGSSGESSSKESTYQPRSDLSHPTLKGLPVGRLQRAVGSIGFIIRLQKRGLSV